MTRNLSLHTATLALRWPYMKGAHSVSDGHCPWCEQDLPLEVVFADEGECPACLTSWHSEDEPAMDQTELALAA